MSIRYPGGLITKTPVTPSGPTGTNTAPGVWTIEQALEYQKAGNWPSSAGAIDSNFEYVTMLLPGNGTNGAQNNTFLDSSANNFTITRNGNTTQGTFSPYGDNWSNYFDGNGDYLQLSYNSAFSFGSGDFTIEGWWYLNNLSSAAHPITFAAASPTSANDIGFYIYIDGSANEATVCNGGSYYSVTGWSVQLNSWQHFAFVRQSGTLRFYINGVQVGSLSANVSINDNAAWTLKLGAYRATSPTRFLNGYLSNVRLLKGTCQYLNGTTFTPPTAPLTAITNTSLLTCQSNRFIDNSTNNFTITVNGNTSVQRFSPFSPTASYAAATIGGSGYFDGTGDYLSVATNSAFDFGSGAFTIEGWVYINSFPAGGATTYGLSTLYASGDSDAGTDVRVFIAKGSTLGAYTDGVVFAVNSTVVATSGSFTFNTGQWYHVAVTRSSNSIYIFIDGVLKSTTSYSSTLPNATTYGPSIGTTQYRGAGLYFLTGYISNVRVLKGTAQYTSTFTPPTSPVTAITNTSLLLNMTNAGIIDNAMMNDLETVGNAQISTTQSKFGGGSLAFDGTGDYLVCRADKNLTAFGSGDWTIEFWIYFNAIGDQRIYDSRGTTNDAPMIYMQSGGQIAYFTANNVRITGSVLSTGTWYHIAVARSGTSTKMFVNGTQTGSTYTDTNVYDATAGTPIIGTNGTSLGSDNLNGYIDDLRITKGIARYTTNFTAPTAAFPTR